MSVRRASATNRPASARWRAAWGALDAAATPLSMLAMLEGLVRNLGAADYGLLVMAQAAAALALALSPAIVLTTTHFVSEAAHQGDERAVVGVVTSALAAVAALDLLLLAAAVAWRSPLAGGMFGAAAPVRTSSALLLVAMGTVILQQLDAVLAATLRGLERFRRQAVVEVLARGTIAVLAIGEAWLSGDVLRVLVVQCGLTAAFLLVRFAALRRLLAGAPSFLAPSREHFARLMRFGGWMSLYAIAGSAYASVDRLVVGHVLGAASAGHYAVEVQVMQLIHFVPASLFAFALPAFSRLGASTRAAEDRQALRRLLARYQAAACAIAVALAVVLVAAWPWVLHAVAGGAPGASPPSDITTAALLAAGFLMLAASVLPSYVLIALGRSRTVALVTTGSVFASLALVGFLVPAWGLVGAAAARLPCTIGFLALPWAARRILREPDRQSSAPPPTPR